MLAACDSYTIPSAVFDCCFYFGWCSTDNVVYIMLVKLMFEGQVLSLDSVLRVYIVLKNAVLLLFSIISLKHWMFSSSRVSNFKHDIDTSLGLNLKFC